MGATCPGHLGSGITTLTRQFILDPEVQQIDVINGGAKLSRVAGLVSWGFEVQDSYSSDLTPMPILSQTTL